MSGYFLKLIVIFAMCMLLTGVSAKPLGNHWYPTDPRCSGSFRSGRSVTSNNNSGQQWMFNGNSGSCERQYGDSGAFAGAFSSKQECDQACLNIYHFS